MTGNDIDRAAFRKAADLAMEDPEGFADAIAEVDREVSGIWLPNFVAQLTRRYKWGAVAWDPWAALGNRPDIELRFVDFDDGIHLGYPDGKPGAWTISLGAKLDRREIRCVLAHELIHIERTILAGPRPLMEREEAIVRAEVARRLVPTKALADLLSGSEIGVDTTDTKAIEDAFDVTQDVAVEAIVRLRAHVTNGADR